MRRSFMAVVSGPAMAVDRVLLHNHAMSILQIARMGHPVLRARARELERAEVMQPTIQHLIDNMIDTMHEYHGVGLAGPQIHEGLRIFVAAISPEDDEPLPAS